MLAGNNPQQQFLGVHRNPEVVQRLAPLLPGFQITTAKAGASALTVARRMALDFYVLADKLPDMTGFVLCRSIRQFDPYTPVVLWFDSDQDVVCSEVARAGAHGFLTDAVDPFTASQMITNLANIARERSLNAIAAEYAAVCEELAQRLREAKKTAQDAQELLNLANDRLLMARAQIAFAAAKGARADFGRLWPGAFKEACRKLVGEER